jgi:Cd2+/Zn2+-exporting ATPase
MAAAGLAECRVCELHAEAVFRVEGMDCHEEVVILERRLRGLGGLEAVAADLIRQRLHVKYDAARLTTGAMVEAVGQTGMRMWLEHEAPRPSAADVGWRLRLTVLAGAAISAGLASTALGHAAPAGWLFTAAAVAAGWFPALRAVSALRARSVDINVLMLVAVIGAVVLGEQLEAAAVVFLFALAQWLETRTLERARQAIRALVDLAPRQALVVRDGAHVRVAVEELVVGDRIVVRPGEKFPADGRIVSGRSDVNEAPLTGESLPVDKAEGQEVYAGTINGRGALDVSVTRLGRDTRLAHIIHLVEDAQSRRAPIQSFVDRFARIYTPAVIGLAVLVAVVPPIAAGADPSTWVYRALVLLVISCPCALVISTPVSIVSALSAAARHGVLIKGGAFLERLAGVRVVAFDKTGTLTTARLRVIGVEPAAGVSTEEVLSAASAVESRSEHPVARAILEHARGAGVRIPAATGFLSSPGLGAEAWVSGRRVLVGSRVFLDARGLRPPLIDEDGAASTVYVGADGRPIGVIRVADHPRDTAPEMLELLRSQGIRRLVMLTGDGEAAARAVAGAVGLEEWHAALLPERKHALIQQLRGAGGSVLMVGDGVNDAPALAAADIGVAMAAAASDAALETADVALMSDELLKLPYMLRLARATLVNVKVNVAVSLVLKAAFLVMAIAGSATLWMAVLADTGASVIVVLNALRLLRAK